MSQKYQFYISALCRRTIKLIDGNTEWLDSFSSCRPPGGWQYQPTFRHQYFKNGESKQNFDQYVCERLFSGLSNDTQIDRLCTFGSVVIDVLS